MVPEETGEPGREIFLTVIFRKTLDLRSPRTRRMKTFHMSYESLKPMKRIGFQVHDVERRPVREIVNERDEVAGTA